MFWIIDFGWPDASVAGTPQYVGWSLQRSTRPGSFAIGLEPAPSGPVAGTVAEYADPIWLW